MLRPNIDATNGLSGILSADAFAGLIARSASQHTLEVHLLIAFVVLAVIFRVATLIVSIRNEKRLKAHGAVEVEAVNSAILALAHIAFYVAAIIEGFSSRGHAFDATTMAGLAVYGFGAAVLVAVIRSLGRFWTVKLLIASDHELVAIRCSAGSAIRTIF